MRLRYTIFLFFLALHFSLYAQVDSVDKKVEVQGYVKFLHSSYVISDQDLLTDQLIHNRLNLRQSVSKHHEWVVQLRNRLFYGEAVKRVQTLGTEFLDLNNPDRTRWLKPSFGVENDSGIAALFAIDRAYWQWTPDNWEIRVGRQRINWGISTIWNPNDIFNAYGFADFDYEERPAADAIRVRRFIGYSGSIEGVISVGQNSDDISIGALYKTFVKTYDLQFLVGHTDGYVALGAGTAGNLGLTGLKAESTLFIPDDNNEDLSFSATAAVDYTFDNGLYASAGFLYNSLGGTSNSLSELFAFDLSARNLYPYRWAIVFAANYGLTELLMAGLSMIYSPVSAQALFIMPTLTYSIAQEWDLDFVSQLSFNNENGQYVSPFNGVFLRIKVSF